MGLESPRQVSLYRVWTPVSLILRAFHLGLACFHPLMEDAGKGSKIRWIECSQVPFVVKQRPLSLITSVATYSSPNYCVSAHIAGYENLKRFVNILCFVWTLKMFWGGWPLPHLVWTTGLVPPSNVEHYAERILVLWESFYIEGACEKRGFERRKVFLSSLSSGAACFQTTRMLLSNEANNATSVYKISASSNYSRSQKFGIKRRRVWQERLQFARVYYTARFSYSALLRASVSFAQ